jgi:hypothetical protein
MVTLLELPLEIREIIYDGLLIDLYGIRISERYHCDADDDDKPKWWRKASLGVKTTLDLSIMRTCRQLCAETRGTLYIKNTFIFSGLRSVQLMQQHISLDNFLMFCHVVLEPDEEDVRGVPITDLALEFSLYLAYVAPFRNLRSLKMRFVLAHTIVMKCQRTWDKQTENEVYIRIDQSIEDQLQDATEVFVAHLGGAKDLSTKISSRHHHHEPDSSNNRLIHSISSLFLALEMEAKSSVPDSRDVVGCLFMHYAHLKDAQHFREYPGERFTHLVVTDQDITFKRHCARRLLVLERTLARIGQFTLGSKGEDVLSRPSRTSEESYVDYFSRDCSLIRFELKEARRTILWLTGF